MKSPILASLLTGALVGLALCATAPAAHASSQALLPRAAADKRTQQALPASTPVERLVVKFHEGSHVRLRGKALVSLASERSLSERALLAGRNLTEARLVDDVKAVQALLERAPRIAAVRRLFPDDEATLESRKDSGEAQSGRQLADLNLYFEVPLVPGTTAERVEALIESLHALASVEVAYAQPPAEPAMVNFGMDAVLRGLLAAADIAPATPLYEANQGYLNAAPAGIDARYAWGVPGGTGAGVRIVDIEGGWRTTHEDLPALFRASGTQVNDVSWRNHGTAVLGEMVGVANGYGVTGISPAAQAGYESHIGVGVATAVTRAAAAVGPGGIVLIEAHAQGPADSTPCTCNTSQCNFIAMEYWQGEYDAIATATANGVVVVEAAGNGSANLDDAAYGGRFNRAVRDSGAILVGASQGSSRAPTCWTNFGGRVDVHGWGQSVTTLGYGDLFGSAHGEDQYYTSTFSGTSSASPVVTGAAASLQGASLAAGRGLQDSRTLRHILASTGTAQSADSRNIGPLPDLRRALARVAPPDLPIAFQANTGTLWVVGPGGPGDLGFGMAAGTSPSLTRLTNGGIQVAFQANNGRLYTWGSAGTADLGFGMAAGTSPSITALPNGGYQIAFQANTGKHFYTGSAGAADTGFGMAANTSPSIASLATGGFQIAFQANTGMLFYTGSAGSADTRFGMAARTSPSITGLAGGGFQIAFQANTGSLFYTGSAGAANTGFGMAANTSPSIVARSPSGFDIVFQANTGTLWRSGTTSTDNFGFGMAGGTSPGAR
jgi:hypothetical protein